MKRDIWQASCLCALVLLQHLQLLSLAGFPVTVGGVCGVFLIMDISGAGVRRTILPSLIVVICLGCAAGIFSPAEANLIQMIRTGLLFSWAATSLSAVMIGGRDIRVPRYAPQVVLACLTTVVAISTIQVVLGSFGNTAAFNLFGSHQYLYEYDPLIRFNPIPRAQGFYLEPSYNAFVISSLGAMLLMMRRYLSTAVALTALGLLVTRSATGLVLMVLVLLVTLIRRKSLAALSITAMGGLTIYKLVWPYLIDRISSVSSTGSSANYRLAAPIQVVSGVLRNHPLGMPLGSIQSVMATYGLANGSSVGTSLDNGYYVLIFYFGWIGLLAIISYLGLGVFLLLTSSREPGRSKSLRFVGIIWLLVCPTFSGGIMLPEFIAMTFMVLLVYHGSIISPTREVLDADSVDRHSDVQGPRGCQSHVGVG